MVHSAFISSLLLLMNYAG